MVGIQYDCASKERKRRLSLAQALDWATEVGKLICVLVVLISMGFTAFLAVMPKS